jgi:hypothetical protein
VTAIAILAGLQLLTCGADPIPPVRRAVIQLHREAPGSAVEAAVRLFVFALAAGFTLGRLGA